MALLNSLSNCLARFSPGRHAIDSGQGVGGARATAQCRYTLHSSGLARELVERTQTTIDMTALEAHGGIGRLIEGKHTTYRGSVPLKRLLFGSHAPFFPCESSLLKLFESPLDLQQLTMLMHANAAK
jgi:hypothetical protein